MPRPGRNYDDSVSHVPEITAIPRLEPQPSQSQQKKPCRACTSFHDWMASQGKIDVSYITISPNFFSSIFSQFQLHKSSVFYVIH